MDLLQESRGQDNYDIDELNGIELTSHLYGMAKIDQSRREQQQLEQVYEKTQEYKKTTIGGSRENGVSDLADLWAEMCNYWDLTGKYDADALAASTPVIAIHGEDLGVDVDKADNLEELKYILDEGLNVF